MARVFVLRIPLHSGRKITERWRRMRGPSNMNFDKIKVPRTNVGIIQDKTTSYNRSDMRIRISAAGAVRRVCSPAGGGGTAGAS
jgi:hypothetical protein